MLDSNGTEGGLARTFSATGIASSQTITAIQYIGTKAVSLTLSANATVTGTAVTITNSLVAQARIMWPYVDKTN